MPTLSSGVLLDYRQRAVCPLEATAICLLFRHRANAQVWNVSCRFDSCLKAHMRFDTSTLGRVLRESVKFREAQSSRRMQAWTARNVAICRRRRSRRLPLRTRCDLDHDERNRCLRHHLVGPRRLSRCPCRLRGQYAQTVAQRRTRLQSSVLLRPII